jgi:hypothetical protein
MTFMLIHAGLLSHIVCVSRCVRFVCMYLYINVPRSL